MAGHVAECAVGSLDQEQFLVGIFATVLSTCLGTLAAIGLGRLEMPWRRPIMALQISPMIVPLVITASGFFFFFSQVNLAKTYFELILAHAALGTPFVIITVTATLVGFNKSFARASANLGAGPVRTFFKVQMPLFFQELFPEPCLHSLLPSIKSSWFCSWRMSGSARSRTKCSWACASKSARLYWLSQRFS